MKLFEKKQKEEESKIEQVPRRSIAVNIDDLPTKALVITYNEFQKKYQQTKDSEVQKKLVLLSKILTDRAYEHGDKQLLKEAKEAFPMLTGDMFQKMTNEEKEKLRDMISKKRAADKAFQELTKAEPEGLEFTMKVETPTKVTAKTEQIKSEKEHDLLKSGGEVFENELAKKSKKKKKGLFSKLNEPLFQKQEKEKGMFGLEYEEKQKHSTQVDELFQEPKKKKSTLGFLKKKKLVPKQKSVNKEITQEQKERAKKMEQATIKSSTFKSLFAKKQKEDPLKGLDIYCSECKHEIKKHRTGCNCGCLLTVEEIAEEHGIATKPKPTEEIVSEINKQGIDMRDQVILAERKEQLNKLKEEIPKEAISQAEKIATMQTKAESKRRPTAEQLTKVEAPKPQMSSKPKPKPTTDELCTCDHPMSEHYLNGTKYEFCNNPNCMCAEFRAYP